MDDSRELRVGGAALGYSLWRPAAPRGALVLLHGVASNRSRWNEFCAATALRCEWALLRPDLRGHGTSLFRGRIGVAEWCDDLAALLDAEGFRRAILVGHCLGANLALHFAARRPQRAAGLVLIEPMPPQALAGTMRRLAQLRPLLQLLVVLARALNALGLHRRELEALDLEELDRITREALARGPEGKAQLDKYASPFADLRSTASVAYLQALLAVTGWLPDLQGIATPALTLYSAQSSFTELAHTRMLMRALPHCESADLDAVHWIPTEQPQGMRLAIEGWVDRTFPRGGAV